ncbi:MAG: c-type cytochrome, partial [Methylosarcina sp.]
RNRKGRNYESRSRYKRFITDCDDGFNRRGGKHLCGPDARRHGLLELPGVKTSSSDAPFPPLAGRDADYLQMALKQYRDKTRKSDIMNAIAGSMSDDDIANVAAYYSRQKP